MVSSEPWGSREKVTVVCKKHFFSLHAVPSLLPWRPGGSPVPPRSRALWALKVLTLGHGTAPLSCAAAAWVSGTSKLHWGSVAQTSLSRNKSVLKSSNLPRAPRIWTNYQSKTCSLGNFSLYTSCSDVQDLCSSQTICCTALLHMHRSLCVPTGTDIPVWQVITCTGQTSAWGWVQQSCAIPGWAPGPAEQPITF